MKRGGGRRLYRPSDVELLRGLHDLLQNKGYTIRGVQKILREDGIEAVKAVIRGTFTPAEPPSEDADEPSTDAHSALSPGAVRSLRAVIAELDACRILLGGDAQPGRHALATIKAPGCARLMRARIPRRPARGAACHDRNLADRPAALGPGPRRAGARHPTPDATRPQPRTRHQEPARSPSAHRRHDRAAHPARAPGRPAQRPPAVRHRPRRQARTRRPQPPIQPVAHRGIRADRPDPRRRDRRRPGARPPAAPLGAPPRRADRRRHGPRRQTSGPPTLAGPHPTPPSCRPGAAWKPSPRRAAWASDARSPTSACATASRARPPRSKLHVAMPPARPSSPCATSRSAAASTQPSPSRTPPACGRRLPRRPHRHRAPAGPPFAAPPPRRLTRTRRRGTREPFGA